MEKLTQNEMAVAIAKDVINQINAKDSNMIIDCGNYFRTNFMPDIINGDLRDILPEILKEKCVVCAKGSALISKARLFDNVPLSNLYSRFYGDIELGASQDSMNEALGDVFSPETLDCIEAAFEITYSMVRYLDYDDGLLCGAVVFGCKFKEPKDRLKAIMQNIVDNNGEFMVESVSEEEMKKVLEDFYG